MNKRMIQRVSTLPQNVYREQTENVSCYFTQKNPTGIRVYVGQYSALEAIMQKMYLNIFVTSV